VSQVSEKLSEGLRLLTVSRIFAATRVLCRGVGVVVVAKGGLLLFVNDLRTAKLTASAR